LPIFTSAELDAHIAACKAALLASPTATEYTVDTGISRTTVKRSSVKELREHLAWLQSEKDQLAGSAVPRTYAKQGGGGRW
jgi:hypothetical protein